MTESHTPPGPAGLRECVAMLRSEDPSLRRKAVCVLDHMTGRRARAARLLVYALRDPSSSVRARAVWALVGVGLGADSIDDKLLDMLDDPSPRVLTKALQAIGLRGQRTQAAVDAVASFLDRSAPMARRLALDTLADIADPDSITTGLLMPMLQDRDPAVRSAAITSLRSIFGPRPEFARPARALLRDPDTDVRSEALCLLIAAGSPTDEVVEEILEAARQCGACMFTALVLLPRVEHIAPRAVHELLSIAEDCISHVRDRGLPPATPGEVRIVTSTDDPRQVVSSWPDLRAWEHPDEGTWRPCDDPGLDLHHLAEASDPPASRAGDMAGSSESGKLTGTYRAFLEAIPQRVRDWVVGFPVGHWRLLNAFSRLGSPAEDLAGGHSHALLFMLAHLDQFQHGCTSQDWSRAAELIRGRQRDTLAALGFEGRESVARLLRKVPPGTCSAPRLKSLRKLLRDPATYKVLAHLPRINNAVLESLEGYDRRLFCTWPLLLEMSESHSEDTAGPAVMALFSVQMTAESLGCVDRLKPVRSLAQLELLEAELLEAEYRLEHEGVVFPPPPLPPLAGRIEPLRTPAELWLEGQDMKHCAANHVHDVVQGIAYVYRVVGREEDDVDRATLMIVRGQTPTGWRIGELRRACNASGVSPATEYTVQQFLAGKEYCDEIGGLLRGLWFGPPEPEIGPGQEGMG